MAGRQRSQRDWALSLLLNTACYIAGMVSGSISSTLSISTMDNAICGDQPLHVPRWLDDTKQNKDGINIAISSSINRNLEDATKSDEFKQLNESTHALLDFDGDEYKDMIENITNTIIMENQMARQEQARYNGYSNDNEPEYTEVVQDIIPHFLRTRYANDLLQYPITR